MWTQERRRGRGLWRDGGEAFHPVALNELDSLESFVIAMLQKSVCSAASQPVPRDTHQPTLGEGKEHGERR